MAWTCDLVGLEDKGIGGGVLPDFGTTTSSGVVGDLFLLLNPMDRTFLVGATGGSFLAG